MQDAWELERCGCHDSTDPDFPVNCGGTNTDDLLLGYSSFRWGANAEGRVVDGVLQCMAARAASRGAADMIAASADGTPPLLPARLSPLGHVVPVGPAQCCQVCLSGTVHPMNQCDDLNSCSGHGVCNLRRCDCFEGWTGPDCAQVRNARPCCACSLGRGMAA